ncbi:hypothetical protein WDU94_006252 [Cyamophila willieti]
MNKSKKKPKSNQECADENIKVVVRCRPMNRYEKHAGMENVVIMDTMGKCVKMQCCPMNHNWGKPKKFLFDSVYDVETSQYGIYDGSVRPMISHMLQGFNVTIFAYGQTGTGKTFTMEGNQSEYGIMQNAFEQIYKFAREQKDKRCVIQCSYLEIYQGKIQDLLNSAKPIKVNKSKLKIPCKGLISIVCKSVQDIEKCRIEGFKNRKVAATCFNEHSSRSHSIFTVLLTLRIPKTKKIILQSKLNLVDLAGSESLLRSEATPLRKKECCEINLSLLAVNKVISSTVAGHAYIPYRDSLLTRLLQDSFGGNSKTLMIANIGPAETMHKETLTTLEYAHQAKKIKIAPRKRPESLETRHRQARIALAKCQKELEETKERHKEKREATTKLMESVLAVLTEISNTEETVDETNESQNLNNSRNLRVEPLNKKKR